MVTVPNDVRRTRVVHTLKRGKVKYKAGILQERGGGVPGPNVVLQKTGAFPYRCETGNAAAARPIQNNFDRLAAF
jgi:hypothetical protein